MIVNRTIVFTVLLIIAAAFPIGKYLLHRISLRSRILLIFLRFFWISLIACAFFEPVFVLERFQTKKNRIPVLIDVSASMNLFSPESTVQSFLRQLEDYQSKNGSSASLSLYAFGDSLRRIPKGEMLEFKDKKSHFPLSLKNSNNYGNKLLLISDGHWSNPRLPPDIFSRFTVYFTDFPHATPKPFIEATVNVPENSPEDSLLSVTAFAHGYSSRESTLGFTLKDSEQIFIIDSVHSDSGHFKTEFSFKFKPGPGRRLYTLNLIHEESGETNVSFPHQTIPGKIGYAFHTPHPTLDVRFISQALKRDSTFVKKTSRPDLLFLSHWDAAADKSLQNLPGHGVAVFLGTLPCSSQSLGCKFTDFISSPAWNFSPDIVRNLPPAEAFIKCSRSQVSAKHEILRAVVTGCSPFDTISVLSSGRFRGTRVLLCAAQGIWKWDLMPMSLGRDENESFLFSSKITQIAKDLVISNLSDSFYLYPSKQFYELDSLAFTTVFPSEIPAFTPLTLNFSFINDDNHIDTSLSFTPLGPVSEQVTLDPLPAGEYQMSCTLIYNDLRRHLFETITVHQDISEYKVSHQNTSFLQQFAHIVPGGEEHLEQILVDQGMGKSIVREIFRLHQSWYLLALIFSLMLLEWILRRRFGID